MQSRTWEDGRVGSVLYRTGLRPRRDHQVRGSEIVPSRDSKVRAGAAADASVTTGRPALGSPVLGSPVVGRPALGNTTSATDQQTTGSGQQAPSGARPSRRSLKNWRVRSRLLLLIIIPT